MAGSDLYGWEFFDLGDDYFARHFQSLSFDWGAGGPPARHTLHVWQMGPDNSYRPDLRALHARFWFKAIEVYGPDLQQIPCADFVGAAHRWWESFSRKGSVHVHADPCFEPLRLPRLA